MTRKAPKLLIIEARFYGDLADELVRGAIRAIEEAGATFERVSVPGVLEIPAALAYAVESGGHDGYVLLGCVIRGDERRDREILGRVGDVDAAREVGHVAPPARHATQASEQIPHPK